MLVTGRREIRRKQKAEQDELEKNTEEKGRKMYENEGKGRRVWRTRAAKKEKKKSSSSFS